MSHADWKSACPKMRAGVHLVVLLAALACVAPPAGMAAATDADHVLLAEIQTLSSTDIRRPLASEYIEIVNPTTEAVDLSDYYLTDAVFASGDQFYWRIADGVPTGSTAGGGAYADFHARFPDGFSIEPGDTVVIAVSGGSKAYQDAYGKLPDFEVYEDGLAPDEVPELREAFPGSINAGLAGGTNTPTLSDGYESVVLYRWDGSSDLVQDVDFAFWGAGSTASQFDKTDVTIGSSTYAADTAVPDQQTIASATLNPGQSYMRKSADEGAEIASGGNGITGHDETSEPLGTTWEITTQGPAAQPDDFFPSAPLITDHGISPAAPYDGQEVAISVKAESFSDLSGATFYVAYDRGPFNPVPGTDAGDGVFTITIEPQSEGTVVSWYVVVKNSEGAKVVYPAWGAGGPESWTVGAVPPPSTDPDKLLLTEICTLGTDQEFVEIYNPNDHDVDMSDYYLTDAIYSPNNQFYWRIAEGNPGPNTVGGGAFGDFEARFPAGFTIAAGDTIVITCPGSAAFSASFGFLPDLEMFEDDPVADNVPDMIPVWGTPDNGSIKGADSIPGLSNAAEIVILYNWHEGDDLVTDIDIFSWKDPSSTTTSFFFDKTGVTVGSSTYGPDTPVSNQHPFGVQLSFGLSYQRTDALEGDQTIGNGNGVNGRDETSENFNVTFTDQLAADPARPGGPAGEGAKSAELVVDAKTFIPTMGESFPIRFISKPQSETRLRIFDQQGRLVITLFDSRFNGAPSVIPGAYTTVLWDGRDREFERVKAGMYIIHLSVIDRRSGDEDTLTAPVVVATRLSN